MSKSGYWLVGLTARVEQMADYLATVDGSPQAAAQAFDRVCRFADSVERVCLRIPADCGLSQRSRDHLAWLRLVGGDQAALSQYVDAVRRATEILEAAARFDRWPRPIIVHFRPTKSVFRVRPCDDRTLVVLPTPMVAVDGAALHGLADAMFRQRAARRETLHAIVMSDAYQELQARLLALGGLADEPVGCVHDLDRSFHRVNTTYFAEQMPRPRLIWSSRMTRGRFGHYNYSTDTIMISRTLDHHDVPTFVIDHVMHHELLHKKHGLRWHDGRGRAHTAEFRAEENRFERYREAEAFLRRLAESGRHARMVS